MSVANLTFRQDSGRRESSQQFCPQPKDEEVVELTDNRKECWNQLNRAEDIGDCASSD
jgi:hypothetical protein